MSSNPDIGEHLHLLIEIVSARNLLKGAHVLEGIRAFRSTSDPYVIVKLGEEEVHRTKYISKRYVRSCCRYCFCIGAMFVFCLDVPLAFGWGREDFGAVLARQE